MRAFLRVFFEDLLAGLMKYLYLCIVNEKRRNLRPAQPTKFSLRAGQCFLGRAKNGVDSEISKNNQRFD
jgi:hypothetical protein